MGFWVVDFVKILNLVDVFIVLRFEGWILIWFDSLVMEYYRRKIKKFVGIIFDNGLSWYKYWKCINEWMF